jgi:hypothetical protein
LFVESDDQVGLVAHVGDVLRPQADADAAGALALSRRRLDLGRDDFDRPDAVTHLAADQAEDLPAFLRALAGIADDLDDMLVDFSRALRSFRGAFFIGRRRRVSLTGNGAVLGANLVDLVAELLNGVPARFARDIDVPCV